MKKATARGRMLPQSLSTDPRIGRVSLKAALLYLLMWLNCDDQGRISGDPDEIKYTACPNRDDVSKGDISKLLKELDTQEIIKAYSTSRTRAVQMLDWWEVQRLQWAWPSRYPPPEGWTDRVRYKPTPKEIVTVNWVPPSQLGGESGGLPGGESGGEPGGSRESSPLTTPSEEEKEEEEGKRRGKGRGNIPGQSPNRPRSPTPSSTGSSKDEKEILRRLTAGYKMEWGRVPAGSPDTVIPREPGARESAQLRDLAKELSSAGGCRLDYIDQAFREAAGLNKHHVSYVRAILLDWLGMPR